MEVPCSPVPTLEHWAARAADAAARRGGAS